MAAYLYYPVNKLLYFLVRRRRPALFKIIALVLILVFTPTTPSQLKVIQYTTV